MKFAKSRGGIKPLRIPIHEIHINPGRRNAEPVHVNELYKSIADVGLLNPITVDGSYTLIAGLHRLEAAKLLGWAEIECTVCDIDSIRAELAEIDENVIRRSLTNTEVSGLLARRKKLYETLHPETIARNRPGHVNNHQSSNDNVSLEPKVKSFVEDTAEKLGVSTRTIKRHLWLAEHLAPEAGKILKGMGKQQPSRNEIMKLARLEPDQQVAALFASGSIKSVDEYLKQVEPEVTESEDSTPKVAYNDFIGISSEVLHKIEELCTSLGDNFHDLTPEQANEVQAQVNKLHEAVDKLAARFKDVG